MIETILLDGREITYDLVCKNVKNINLRIRADCTVSVSANATVPANVVADFLREKSSYILNAIDRYAERLKYATRDHSYVTGESFRYLGKELRLKLMRGKSGVAEDGIYLYLTAPDDKTTEAKSRQISRWYEQRCRDIFPQVINELYPTFRKYGVAQPSLVLREMSSRWGSCQPKHNTITLNKRLIEMPRNHIEYVVMHEFIHFLHPNHSNEFYELLSTLMPDWRERKNALEKEASPYTQKSI